MSNDVFRKTDLPSDDEYETLLEAKARSDEKRIEEAKRETEDIKDRRREDWASTTKWGITVVIAITVALIGALTYQVHSFNGELREVRDRLTVIETERRIEQTTG